MPHHKRLIPTVPLTAGAWEPFGWLPVQDTDPSDGLHRLSFEWDDPHVNLIGHALEEVPSSTEGLHCEVMYRHRTHTQVLMPIDHDCVVAVAAPGADLTDSDAGQLVHAFALRPLQPVVLHCGTWHWGPFPVGAPQVRLFNVQGFRYREDNERADVSNLGLVVSLP